MTETTVDHLSDPATAARPAPTDPPERPPVDPVTLALLAVIDADLDAGTGRQPVLAAALAVAGLDPDPADLAAVRAEVLEEHDCLVRVLTKLPAQRTVAATQSPVRRAADLLLERRLEVLDLVVALVGAVVDDEVNAPVEG